ncbi:MAG TPA: phosphate ABC transporter permease subunit PstC [Cyanobacteria bacterium UBA8156]|jgi:phosphate transport system permease protein|nr:phosphate ABC transporter permease subunit PstC [Cyanobacteria bacterium UBA8156]
MAEISRAEESILRSLADSVEIDIKQQNPLSDFWEKSFTGVAWGGALIAASVLFLITWRVSLDAWPAIQAFGPGFLVGREWVTDDDIFGALVFVYGTLVSAGLGISLAILLGVAVAILTSEDLVPNYVRRPIAFLVELLAAIPSVIVGLWGVNVLIPRSMPLQGFLHNNFKWLPLFSSEPIGQSLFAAGMVLAVMVVPTVAAVGRESLLAVPPELRSASMGLGATRWETVFKIQVRTALSGIIGGVMLALGRALGETMAVAFVIGSTIQISPSLLDAGYSIPVVLANEFGEAISKLHIGALMYLSLILFAITLIVNVAALLLVQLVSIKSR